MAIAPTSQKRVLSHLVCNSSAEPITGAWILAKGGINASGALSVRLLNELGSPITDFVDVFGSSSSKVKFPRLRMNIDDFPQTITVEAHNRSNAAGSTAYVLGVLYTQ